MTHGASDGKGMTRLVKERADELLPDVLGANPHLDQVRDGPALFRYCVSLARIERVYRWLAEQDDEVFVDRKAGEVHAVYGRLERWENQASRAEEQLAIAPLTRARLGLDLQRAQQTAGERQRAREARERLDRRALEVVVDGSASEAARNAGTPGSRDSEDE